jgi:hypothetical protein
MTELQKAQIVEKALSQTYGVWPLGRLCLDDEPTDGCHCTSYQDICRQRDPYTDDFYYCCLALDHEGDHIALQGMGHICARWPQKD